jgi:hypothetical protein
MGESINNELCDKNPASTFLGHVFSFIPGVDNTFGVVKLHRTEQASLEHSSVQLIQIQTISLDNVMANPITSIMHMNCTPGLDDTRTIGCG